MMTELAPLLAGEFTPDEKELLKARLYELASLQTERFTWGQSTSVRKEVAEELIKSLTYTLMVYKRAHGSAPLVDRADWETLLGEGAKMLEAKIKATRRLYLKTRATAPKFATRAYRDTILSIGAGFRKYDYTFFAHTFPASIDYQLAAPVDESILGIDYIDEYLSRLLIENRFMGRFPNESVLEAVNEPSEFYEAYENIYEAVATRALTGALIGASPARLAFIESQMQAVRQRLLPLDENEAMALLLKRADELCWSLFVTDEKERSYVLSTAKAFLPRLLAALNKD